MLIDDIAITMIPDIGCRTVAHIMNCFNSAQELFSATSDEIAARTELKPSLIERIVRRESHSLAEREIEFISRNKITAIPFHSPLYPQRLKECCDYPYILYSKGDMDLNSGHWLSVVGTRKVSPYGAKYCDRIIGELSEMFDDLVIVSGLAYGVDIASHRAAMMYGRKTVAVMGIPLTKIYPSHHTESARKIISSGGALLSEFPSCSNSDKSGFVQRNRVIAGLSEGTLIIESAAKGGSLITADMADGYNRTVMALPGRIGDSYSEGTNKLIRTLKAQMICSGEDVANVMDWEIPSRIKSADATQLSEQDSSAQYHPDLFALPNITDAESGTDFATDTPDSMQQITKPKYTSYHSFQQGTQNSSQSQNGSVPRITTTSARLLDALSDETPIGVDELALNLSMSIGSLSALLLDLELSGYIRALPGKLYVKC